MRITLAPKIFNVSILFKNILVTICTQKFLFLYPFSIPRLATGQAFTCQQGKGQSQGSCNQ